MTTQVFKGHNLDIVPRLPQIDCVITSPPYKSGEGYSTREMVDLHRFIGSKLAPGGWYFINFAQLKEDYSRPFELQQALARAIVTNLKVGPTIVWVKSIVIEGVQKGHFQPINGASCLNYCWEFIFTFYRPCEDGSTPGFDRLSIGVPYADLSNLSRGTRGKNGNLHCAGDVWFIPYRTTGKTDKKRHKYEFPEELVERCIKVAGLKEGSTVLDPFGGSGTVGVVANRLGHNAILIELEGD